ncbi:MAG: class I SAM-dependent methyltransferase [Ignavibacteriaceae bacterium]|nr:class I SAM-dependent methyltransferase [Ignavibacteriaceae bacterium]MCW8814193.1 class I SAM-dependent methyltransferase [Chlorobium sp.]MCW8816624.1 class I SAM-dependent methyltransferase [Ignavibacteriaceae bacterium]MCW8823333.1 class I SAM-dependent methyltransferase [Ignavibacteriaceae bacterium]MCW9094742.1 class I SAM-dependent methyltransferase [Ignavibacteriaceae bacterium]
MADFNYIDHYKKDALEFDYFEERTGATEHDERRVREYIISKIPKSVNSILDVGCGKGWVAKEFLPKGKTVVSLDISVTNPSIVKKLYSNPKHFAIAADSFHLPLNDNSFDCVIASEIIEHVVDPAGFIKELFRVIKKGESLIITTPYKEKLIYYLCIHCNQKTPANAHIHSFDEKKLESLYYGNDLESFKYEIFGNKILLFLRTYVILQFFPFWLWKLKDKFFNLIINKPVHIICIYKKK